MKASVTQVGTGGDLALSPPPGFGFSGAAALDESGKFAGVALLKPVVVATSAAANAAPAAQGVLVTADTVREFLEGEWRDGERRVRRCEGRGGAGDLREEIVSCHLSRRSGSERARRASCDARW